MKSHEKRLVVLEADAQTARLEQMTDAELEAIVNEDPVSGHVFKQMTDEELHRLAAGDLRMEKVYRERLDNERRNARNAAGGGTGLLL